MHRRSASPSVTVLTAFSFWVWALPAAAQAGGAESPVSARSYAGPIIDMHLHAYIPDDYWGAAPSPATGRPAPASAGEHMEQSIEVMRRYNVVLGAASGEAPESARGVLSWMPGLEGVLESFLRRAQAMGMLDRVMFGSDQMVWPDAIGLAVERIDGMGFLSVEEKAGIFYDNAARFLGLSDETIARHHEAAARPYARGS